MLLSLHGVLWLLVCQGLSDLELPPCTLSGTSKFWFSSCCSLQVSLCFSHFLFPQAMLFFWFHIDATEYKFTSLTGRSSFSGILILLMGSNEPRFGSYSIWFPPVRQRLVYKWLFNTVGTHCYYCKKKMMIESLHLASLVS